MVKPPPPVAAPKISLKKAKAPAAHITVAKKSPKPAHPASTAPSKPDEKVIKKPVNAFIYFTMDHRKSVMAEFPDLHHTKVVSKLGTQWKEMTDSQKKPYLLLAEKDRNRYHAEKEFQPKTTPVSQKSTQAATNSQKSVKSPMARKSLGYGTG